MSDVLRLRAGYAAIVLASAYALFVEFFGIEVPDTFFYATLYSTDGYIDAFRPLSEGVFRLTTAVFGQYILPVRLVCWLFYYGACLLTLWLTLSLFPDKKPTVCFYQHCPLC